jgi:cbb3-type cytochrome oxidase maturation protein
VGQWIVDVDILYILIPLSVVLVAVIVTAFLWAIRSGQFDDLDGPAHRILLDDDERQESSQPDAESTTDRHTDMRSR